MSDLYLQAYVSEDPIPGYRLDEIIALAVGKEPGATNVKVVTKSGRECGLPAGDCYSEMPHTHVFVRWTPQEAPDVP